MRLIDADAFVTEHRKIYCENCERRKNSKGKVVYEVGGVPCRACYIGDVIDDVDCSSTVDAVPVVRCKDCIHQVPAYECIFCKINWTNPPLDGFCSYGERNDE